MEFNIREYQSEDESAVLALIQKGMGGGPTGERDVRFWRWKHFENPFGKSIALVAVDGTGQVIGLRTFMRWRLNVGDKVVVAVRAVDTVTHPEYRRYGVFSELTRQAVQQVKSSGVDLIFNTPNNQVLPGYLKLGWTYVSLVRPMIKVLNYPRFVTGMLRNRNRSRTSGQIPLQAIFGDRVKSVAEYLDDSKFGDRLFGFHPEAGNGRLATGRSPEYLRWRYSKYPNVNYGVVCRGENGASPGCAILRSSARFGLKEAVLVEMLLPRPDAETASRLLDELKKRSTADYIIAYFPEGSFKRKILLKHGFHQVPSVGQNFTVNQLNPSLPCDPRLLESWDLSLGDLEVF